MSSLTNDQLFTALDVTDIPSDAVKKEQLMALIKRVAVALSEEDLTEETLPLQRSLDAALSGEKDEDAPLAMKDLEAFQARFSKTVLQQLTALKESCQSAKTHFTKALDFEVLESLKNPAKKEKDESDSDDEDEDSKEDSSGDDDSDSDKKKKKKKGDSDSSSSSEPSHSKKGKIEVGWAKPACAELKLKKNVITWASSAATMIVPQKQFSSGKWRFGVILHGARHGSWTPVFGASCWPYPPDLTQCFGHNPYSMSWYADGTLYQASTSYSGNSGWEDDELLAMEFDLKARILILFHKTSRQPVYLTKIPTKLQLGVGLGASGATCTMQCLQKIPKLRFKKDKSKDQPHEWK